jgi:alkylation response protein AidB-like acyl-CoA dehydrogenase
MLLPTEDQDMLRQAAREFLADRAGSERLRAALDTPSGHDTELWKQISGLGWTALALPEEHGGLDAALADLAVVIEECGRTLIPGPLTAVSAVGWLLVRHASAGQRAALLPGLGDGEAIAVCSIGGPDNSGVVAAAPGLRLTGVRRHVADVAVASHVVLDVDTPQGPALAVVPTAAPGLSWLEEHTIDMTRRYFTLRFDDVPVKAEMLMGQAAVAEMLRAAVVLQCAESVGVAARAFEMTCGYVNQRSQFGRLIGSFQAVKHRIADLYIELEGARVATRDAAEAVQADRPDAAYATHVAKSWTARAASVITSEAIQLHGGIGFTWEHDLHLLQRRAKANELVLGTPAWHDEQLTIVLDDGTPAP